MPDRIKHSDCDNFLLRIKVLTSGYSGIIMITVRKTDEFEKWFATIKDKNTRIRLSRRLDKAGRGFLGDVKPVGSGVHEMREFLVQAGECTMWNVTKS